MTKPIPDLSNFDALIVGAGLTGATVANVLSGKGFKVLVVDKRNHIAGNAFDYIDEETDVRVHKYGAHIFHTSNEEVWEYLNRFAEFNNYQHRVFAESAGELYSFPINLMTISQVYGRFFNPDEARKQIARDAAEVTGSPQNLEEKAISLIGRPLYEKFVKGYTEKQWAQDPRDLPAHVITRLPVRFDLNNRYFADKYEGIPIEGYTDMVDKMLGQHYRNVTVELGVDYFDLEERGRETIPTLYTGPIDAFFDHSQGHLNWRTVDFDTETVPGTNDALGTSVINYSDMDIRYTRVIEFKHFHPERKTNGTVLAYESSRSATSDDEAYYPVNVSEDRERMKSYEELAASRRNVQFGGRLGTYKYLDMHQAVAIALKTHVPAMIEKIEESNW
jgi:UDP-galactopyranose mutase